MHQTNTSKLTLIPIVSIQVHRLLSDDHNMRGFYKSFVYQEILGQVQQKLQLKDIKMLMDKDLFCHQLRLVWKPISQAVNHLFVILSMLVFRMMMLVYLYSQKQIQVRLKRRMLRSAGTSRSSICRLLITPMSFNQKTQSDQISSNKMSLHRSTDRIKHLQFLKTFLQHSALCFGMVFINALGSR